MEKKREFDYYYGTEAKQFSFYRIPRALIKDPSFKELSNDAKLLYGLMLDRMSLSMKNGWLDVKNKVYIIYKIEDVMEDLGCSKPTSIKIIRELEKIGLIEKMRSGGGKPDIIYVKNFLSNVEENQNKEAEQRNSEEKNSSLGHQKNASQEAKNFNFQGQETSLPEVKNLYSYGKNNLLPEVKNPDRSYSNNNYTKSSNTNPIYPSRGEGEGEPASTPDRIDRMDEVIAYRVLVRKNLEYDLRMEDQHQDANLFQEIYEIICDIVCINRIKVRIGGQDCSYEIVKSRFLKLNYYHIEYVMECLKKNTTKIANIKAYLITALYNAPLTMNNYYRQEVQHNMDRVG